MMPKFLLFMQCVARAVVPGTMVTEDIDEYDESGQLLLGTHT